MVYSNWDYAKRRFEELPAGYVGETTLGHDYVSCILDVADNVFVRCGLGVITTGYGSGGIRTINVPSAAGDKAKFLGVLIFDASNYRYPNQPIRTHNNKDMVNTIRKGSPRVITTVAITDIEAPVYLIHTADTGENPGEFKTSAGTNAFLIEGAKWARTTSEAGVATLELLSAPNPA